MSEEVLPINQLNTSTQKCKRLFQGQERDSYKLSSNKTQNFSISTTSLSGNFQILNTKVRIDEEILKTANASKMNAKGVITQFNERMQNPKKNKLIAKD